MVTTHTAHVDTETGRAAVLDVHHHETADAYTIVVSGHLLDQAIEAVTAAVQLALLEVRAERARFPHRGCPMTRCESNFSLPEQCSDLGF